jgi:hypothetical protein
MGREDFRPSWKPVDDKELAWDMAGASNAHMNEALKIKQQIKNRRGAGTREELSRIQTLLNRADIAEIGVEAEAFAKEEAYKCKTAGELQFLLNRAIYDRETTRTELKEFLIIYNKSSKPEKRKRNDTLRDLEAKSHFATKRMLKIEEILQFRKGKKRTDDDPNDDGSPAGPSLVS